MNMHEPEKHLIPLSIVKDIRCAQCNKFVSCGPVTVVPNENVLCGRCYLFAKQEFRNHAFEALAQIFWFPCCNWEKQCSRKLEWNQNFEHEDICAYENWCSRFWKRGLCCSSRREIPIGDIRHTPVPPQLLDDIKCVQCHGYANCEPVFILSDGSNVCHRCVRANGPPPNSRRNLVYEQLSRILVFPCIFRNRGCPTRLKFGGDLWEHETKCPYNTSLRRQSQANKRPGQKERGVITTHSGHYYGTLTPNSLLFAPPTPNKEYDVNKDIVKSLKKHQERKIVKADQLQTQMSEKYSEDSYNEEEKSSRASTPSRYEEDIRQRIQHWQAIDRSSPENRDSGYQTGSLPKSENNEREREIIPDELHDHIAQFLPRYVPKPDYDRDNSGASSRASYINAGSDNNITGFNPKFHIKFDMERENSRISYNGSRPSCSGSEKNMFEGHSQETIDREADPLAYNPSYRAVNRSESVKSNKELIKELKVKLKKTSSMRKDTDSPYVQCNSLEDVLDVHDKIAH